MFSKRFSSKLVVRIDKGEEIVASLMKVCKEHNVVLGSVSGIGATNKVKVGLFDVDTKEYLSKEFSENFEIAPLAGNISTKDGETYLHLHINLCDARHNSFGGHSNSAIVSATCECVIDIIDGKMDREFSEEIGLNLLKP